MYFLSFLSLLSFCRFVFLSFCLFVFVPFFKVFIMVIIRRSADRAELRRTSEVQFELVSAHQTSAMLFLKVVFCIFDNFEHILMVIIRLSLIWMLMPVLFKMTVMVIVVESYVRGKNMEIKPRLKN